MKNSPVYSTNRFVPTRAGHLILEVGLAGGVLVKILKNIVILILPPLK